MLSGKHEDAVATSVDEIRVETFRTEVVGLGPLIVNTYFPGTIERRDLEAFARKCLLRDLDAPEIEVNRRPFFARVVDASGAETYRCEFTGSDVRTSVTPPDHA